KIRLGQNLGEKIPGFWGRNLKKSRGGEHAKTRDEKNLDFTNCAHNTGLAILAI
ncbi:unnamed protein product, partial [marine sediment metagenome]